MDYHRGWLAVEAVAGILAGILTLLRPGIATLSLAFIIATWAMMWVLGIFGLVYGSLLVALAIKMRRLADTVGQSMPRAA